MSEIKPDTLMNQMPQGETVPRPWSGEDTQNALAVLGENLDDIGSRVPEVRQRQGAILRGARVLVDTFQVGLDFFDDNDRTIIFASLASKADRLSEAQGQSLITDRHEHISQLEFVSRAAFILTRRYSNAFPELVQQFEYEQYDGKKPTQGMAEALCRYEHPGLSRDLRDSLEWKRVIDETRERLGVDTTAEMPPVHVLAIGRNALQYFNHTATELTEQEAKEWQRGLEARTDRFMEEWAGGVTASSSNGFTEVDHGGREHIFIPMALAEIVLAAHDDTTLDDIVRYYSLKERLLGTLGHEYTHTVGDLTVEDEMGKAIEEFRAEYYSGGKGEYHDVKRLFWTMNKRSGNSIMEMFDRVAEGRRRGDEVSFYELLADGYGLDIVSEMAAVQPSSYLRFSKNSFVHEMLGPLKDFRSIIRRYTEERAAKR